MSTNTYEIYTPRDDAIMPQACMAQPATQSVSHPPCQMLQQLASMDVETGTYIESGPQMWYPPSTHQQGYYPPVIYRKDNSSPITLVMIRGKVRSSPWHPPNLDP
eukprot:3712867-Amphidinium_carterae.1